MKKYTVCTIIVTWNNEQDIEDCIKSLLTQSFSDNHLIVVDNNSNDQTVSIVKQKFPQVEVLTLPVNTFFTGGANYGAKYAMQKYQVDYLLLINPDTIANPDMLKYLLESIVLDDQTVAAGPKIMFDDNRKIYSAGVTLDGFRNSWQRGHLEIDHGQLDRIEQVDCIEGTCMLIKTQALKQTDLFWSRLKMYLEDVELALRLKRSGWKMIYDYRAKLQHKYMRSTKQNTALNVEKLKNRNWLWIALRHYPFKSKLAMFKQFLLFYLK